MRKVFELGGVFGVKFSKAKAIELDLEEFVDMKRRIALPSGEIGDLTSVNFKFQAPDFNNALDVSRHRISEVDINVETASDTVTLNVPGAYYTHFLESSPPIFAPEKCADMPEDIYLNDSLKALMNFTRGLFMETIEANNDLCEELPPASFSIDFNNASYSIKEMPFLNAQDTDTLLKAAIKESKNSKLALLVSEIIAEMKHTGYLERSFVSEGDYMRPDFKKMSWESNNLNRDDYFKALSEKNAEGCPAYIHWGTYFEIEIKRYTLGLIETLLEAGVLADKQNLFSEVKTPLAVKGTNVVVEAIHGVALTMADNEISCKQSS